MHYAVSGLLLLIIRGFVGLFPFASKLSALWPAKAGAGQHLLAG